MHLGKRDLGRLNAFDSSKVTKQAERGAGHPSPDLRTREMKLRSKLFQRSSSNARCALITNPLGDLARSVGMKLTIEDAAEGVRLALRMMSRLGFGPLPTSRSEFLRGVRQSRGAKASCVTARPANSGDMAGDQSHHSRSYY